MAITIAFRIGIFIVKLNLNYKAVSSHETQRNSEKNYGRAKKKDPKPIVNLLLCCFFEYLGCLLRFLVISPLLLFVLLKVTLSCSTEAAVLKLHDSGLDLNPQIFPVICLCLRAFPVVHLTWLGISISCFLHHC